MAYIGNTVQNQGFTPAIDYFNGNGVTVTFTLSRPIASVAQVIVAVDNVIQNPSSAFNVVGNSITFTSAPLSGTNNIWVEYTSLITTYQGISQDPTVIGDIRATGGYLAEGDFGNSFVSGAILDYVTGLGRITVGSAEGIALYNGGTSGRNALLTLGATGQVAVNSSGSAATPVISKSDDLNTGIFFPAADTIAFTEGGVESMRIDSSGNVGIGTSSPSEKLSVTGNVTATGTNTSATYFHRSIAPATESNIETSLVTTGNASNQRAGLFATNDYNNTLATGLIFKTNATTGGATEQMRIDSSGNVQIGETGGVSKLNITQSSNSSTAIRIVYSGTGAFPIEAITQNASYTGAGIRSRVQNLAAGTGYYAFSYYNDNAADYRFLVLGNGNVQNTNNSYGALSDVKLKENIVDATPKLEDLCKVKVRQYNLKSDPNHKQIGVVAQELEEVFAGLVEETQDRDVDGKYLGTTTKQVKYSVFVPMLIKAVQELKATVDAQAARIAALEAK